MAFRLRWLAVGVLGVLAIGLGCGAFGSSDGTNADTGDSGLDDGTADDGANDGAAADAPVDSGGLFPQCPPPPFGSACTPSSCPKRTLYVPDQQGAPEYPFAIATDEGSVYWLAQIALPGQTEQQAFNGQGSARLRRVDRVGASDASRATLLVDGQHAATNLALDGDHIYWVTYDVDDAGAASHLRRVRRDCPGNCAIERLGTLPVPIVHLVRPSEGLLFAEGAAGQIYRLEVSSAATSVTPGPSGGVGAFPPSMTATSTAVFASAINATAVFHMPTSPGAQLAAYPALPPVDAGPTADAGTQQGAFSLATDCTSLWAVRANSGLWRAAVGDAGFGPFADAAPAVVYDTAADDSYLYLATANGVGVMAYPSAGGAPTRIGQTWSVVRLAVDGLGVYWGEHVVGNPGTIYMMAKTP